MREITISEGNGKQTSQMGIFIGAGAVEENGWSEFIGLQRESYYLLETA